MDMKQVLSGDGVELKARFYSDPGDILVQPQTVHYEVSSVDGNSFIPVIGWTAATMTVATGDLGTLLDAYAQIDIPGSANVVTVSERRRIRVAADKDTPRQVSEDFYYFVRP